MSRRTLGQPVADRGHAACSSLLLPLLLVVIGLPSLSLGALWTGATNDEVAIAPVSTGWTYTTRLAASEPSVATFDRAASGASLSSIQGLDETSTLAFNNLVILNKQSDRGAVLAPRLGGFDSNLPASTQSDSFGSSNTIGKHTVAKPFATDARSQLVSIPQTSTLDLNGADARLNISNLVFVSNPNESSLLGIAADTTTGWVEVAGGVATVNAMGMLMQANTNKDLAHNATDTLDIVTDSHRGSHLSGGELEDFSRYESVSGVLQSALVSAIQNPGF